MNMGIVPRFKEIFIEPLPELEDLLAGISSEVIIGILAMIHSELNLAGQNPSVQYKILNLFLGRQPEMVRLSILFRLRIASRIEKDEEFAIFIMTYILDFMHYVLANFNNIKMKGDTTAAQELQLFKAYLVFIEIRNVKEEKIFDRNRNHLDDFFFKNTLPMLSAQYEAEHLVNPFPEMVRGLVLLNHLELDTPYGSYVKTFLEKRGHLSSWQYAFTLIGIIQTSWQAVENNDKKTARFFVKCDKSLEPLFNSFAIEPLLYREKYKGGHHNYSGIKDKPLMHYGNEDYLVLNWNFFASKLYEGLLYDFYENSGISENENFPDYRGFKKYVGEKVTEPILFKKLLENTFTKPETTLLFDDQSHQGFPDAYYREEKKIVLFELKDAYYPAHAINTVEYGDIKKAIDDKYNLDGKGTGQIIKQLKKLAKGPLLDSKEDQDPTDLVVYPVLVYTDHFFSMPGINQYLQQQFAERVSGSGLATKFKEIKPLVFLNIRFLINHLDLIRQKETDLISLFELYFQTQENAEAEARRNDSLPAFFNRYQTFAQSVHNVYKDVMYNREGYVKTLLEALELTRGLPTG